MRFVAWLIAVVVVIGVGVGIYMLTPVRGPARDVTLVGDVERGNYLMRLGGCVTCHTDPKTKDALLAGTQSVGLKTPFGTFYPPNITSSKTAGYPSAAKYAIRSSTSSTPTAQWWKPWPCSITLR